MWNSKKLYFIDYTPVFFETLVEWHKEHLDINFPSQKLNKELFKNDLEKELGKKKMILHDEVLIGFVWHEEKDNQYEGVKELLIRYLHIDKNYRGHGFGRLVLQKVLDESNAAICTLGTHVSNDVALGLYQKLGFSPYRIILRRDNERG